MGKRFLPPPRSPHCFPPLPRAQLFATPLTPRNLLRFRLRTQLEPRRCRQAPAQLSSQPQNPLLRRLFFWLLYPRRHCRFVYMLYIWPSAAPSYAPIPMPSGEPTTSPCEIPSPIPTPAPKAGVLASSPSCMWWLRTRRLVVVLHTST